MKKILALLLVLIMATCLFSACSGEKKADNKDAVNTIVSEYIELAFTGDEKALEYVAEGTEIYTTTQTGVEQFAAFSNITKGGNIPEKYASEINKLTEKFVDDVFSLVEYNIADIKISGDKATTTVTLKAPDFEKMGEVNIEEVLLNSFDLGTLVSLETATEEEQGEFMVELMDVYLREVLTVLEKDIEEEKTVFELEENNGKWVISGTK